MRTTLHNTLHSNWSHQTGQNDAQHAQYILVLGGRGGGGGGEKTGKGKSSNTGKYETAALKKNKGKKTEKQMNKNTSR